MVSRIFTALLGALGAGLAAQFPAFYTQYVQHLAGRLVQVNLDLGTLRQEATAQGMEPEAYLAAVEAEGGALTDGLVAGYRRILASAEQLQASYTTLREAGVFTRPFALAWNMDPTSAAAVWRDFVPAMPISMEGLAYALVGLLLGVALAWAVERALRLLRPRRRRREKPGPSRPAQRPVAAKSEPHLDFRRAETNPAERREPHLRA